MVGERVETGLPLGLTSTCAWQGGDLVMIPTTLPEPLS